MNSRSDITLPAQSTSNGTTSPSSALNAYVILTILGKPISSTNSKIQAVAGDRAYSHKSRNFKHYAADFCNQVPSAYRNLKLGSMKRPLRCNITAFFPNWRGDLETKGIYDLLQLSGVLKNDLYAIEQHHYRAIDKENPRVEIIIEEI